MAVVGKSGGDGTRVSLKGSSAALRFADAAQGRAGTVTAFAATGAKPASAVPAAPALPHVKAVHATALPAGTIGKAQHAALIKAASCEEDGDPAAELDVARLDRGRMLVLIPCGAGAYNFSTVPMLVEANGKASVAPFEGGAGYAGDKGQVELVNAGWEIGRAHV